MQYINLLWFENFWMVGGVDLFLVLVLAACLSFVLSLLSMFAFNSSLTPIFNSSFIVSVMMVLEFVFSFSFSVSLVIVWIFSFTVPVLQVSVSTSLFSGLIALFLQKVRIEMLYALEAKAAGTFGGSNVKLLVQIGILRCLK